MANICIVAGKSGTGKSTSMENLDPNETFVINVLGKRLPFKGSSKVYNAENKNYAQIDSYDSIISYISRISSNAPHIKNIILDDVGYVMRKENFASANDKGFGKFVSFAVHFQQIIKASEDAREDLNIFFMLHLEDVISDGIIVEQKISTVGKMLDSQYNIQEVVPLFLCSICKFNEEGIPEYGFITKRSIINGVLYPSKSPRGMFEEDFIPNDLNKVIEAMNEYYN